MSEPLDMPDGPGWWGGRIDGQAVVCHWSQFKVIGDDLKIRWADDDYTMTYSLSWFKSHYRGVKWYRLTMPWDKPQPAIPPDVRDTLRGALLITDQSGINKRRVHAALAWLDAQGGGRNG